MKGSAYYQHDAKVSALFGKPEKISTMNAVNMLGYTGFNDNIRLANDIWDDRLSVNYADTRGDWGNYKEGEAINISQTLLGGGAEDSAKLATVLAHEGSHVYGNHVEGIAHLAAADTYSQINQRFGLNADISFENQIVSALYNPDSWTENTGDVDHWKLMDDGSLAYDGKADLYDENGNLIYKTKSRGIEGSFIEILYGENATKEQIEAARDMLEKNFSHYAKGDEKNRDNWYWNTDANIGKSMSVEQYEDIYKNRILTDFVTGVEATIEQHNPVNIYNAMVANGTMDVKDEYKGIWGSIKGIVVGDKKNISYEDFKANNYITGGMPKEGTDYKVGDPLNVQNGNYNLITTKFLAKGNLGTHYGVDLSAVLDTPVYAMLYDDNTKALFTSAPNGAGGNYTSLDLKLTYNFKGQIYNDSVLQRYMHLNSQTDNFSGNFTDSSFALSGNTGTKTTAPHLHIDISSSKQSPWLNYMSKINGYQTYYNGNNQRTYYAPEMFLKN